MELKAKVIKGKFIILEKDKLQEIIASDGEYSLKIERTIGRRTNQQNKALHLFFTQLAEKLNEGGLDFKNVVTIDVPFTPEMVKNYLWRPIQRLVLKKESTRELNKREDIDLIYDILIKAIGEKFNIYIPFPDINEISNFNDIELP